ncbi:MAG TPA: methionyl-tRNA formyltransferase [Mobilitalea sp.]|nr:methionyl-tRNA formyltransferase [Mobilitalea sp.]
MKVLFMGTPDFAATILAELIDTSHEIIGVVTQPDKQKGRVQEVSFSPVKELALEHGITVYQPVKVKEPEFLETVKELQPEVIVIAAFGQILPKALLDIPPRGCINVHASLLPKYRGAAPIQYSIIDGEAETGITIMYMDIGIDTGDIILQAKLPIDSKETGGSLFDKMAALGSKLLIEALLKIENGTATRIPQDNEKATYVRVIDKNMGKLNFTEPAVKLERRIRGLNPWPSAYTFLEGKTLKLWQAEVEADNITNDGNASALPGEVAEVRKESFVIKTGEGLLVIKELQLEGKKRMTADAFLRGYSIAVGTRLG